MKPRAIRVHYASDRYVRATVVVAIPAGLVIFYFLPDDYLPVASSVARSSWIALGAFGAFCIQLLLQLLTIGEDRSLTIRQQTAVMKVVDERMRYLWDLTAVILLALMTCLMADSAPPGSTRRFMLSIGIGQMIWVGLLGVRLPFLFLEIRNFRWRLASERNQLESRNAVLAALRQQEDKPVHEISEPERPLQPH